MFQVRVESGFGNVQLVADRLHTQLTFSIQCFRRHSGGLRLFRQTARATAFASACSSSLETRLGPLADEIALKLGEGGEDVEYQPPLRRGSVNRIVETDEADLACH